MELLDQDTGTEDSFIHSIRSPGVPVSVTGTVPDPGCESSKQAKFVSLVPPVRAVKCRPHLNFHWLLDAPRRCREQLLGPRFPAAPPKAPVECLPGLGGAELIDWDGTVGIRALKFSSRKPS